MTQGPKVTDNADQARFEVTIDGSLAELTYRRRADRLILIHTEVPDEAGGHGIGGQLVQAAVDKAGKEGLTLIPLCPFARSWLERHSEIASRVAIDWSQPAGR